MPVVALGLSAAFAILVPAILLWPHAIPVEAPPRARVTSVAVASIPGIDALIAAPLFNAGRSPLPLPGAEVADAAPPPPPAPAPTLVGVITRGRGGGVALVKSQTGETVTLPVGGTVDGWRLIAVARSQAVFDMGNRRESVTLEFGKKSGAASESPRAMATPAGGSASVAAGGTGQ